MTTDQYCPTCNKGNHRQSTQCWNCNGSLVPALSGLSVEEFGNAIERVARVLGRQNAEDQATAGKKPQTIEADQA